MSGLERIERLLRIARLAETEAGRRLADSAAALAARQAEVARLKRFLDEYRTPDASRGGAIDAARLANAHAFAERLRAAIEAGEREAAACEERHREDVERWRSAHRRHSALREIAARQAAEALRNDARREQIELDDRFARSK